MEIVRLLNVTEAIKDAVHGISLRRTFPAARLRVRGADPRRVRCLRSLHPGPNGPAFPQRPGESNRSSTFWELRPRLRREFPRRPPSGIGLSCPTHWDRPD